MRQRAERPARKGATTDDKTMPRRRWVARTPTWAEARVGLMFFGGLAGVAYETVAEHLDRPTLLFLFWAMMTGSAFLPRGKS